MNKFKQKQEELKKTLILYLNTRKDKKCKYNEIWNNLTQFTKQQYSRKDYDVTKLGSLLETFNDILEIRNGFVFLRPQFYHDYDVEDEDVVVIDSDDEDISCQALPSVTFTPSNLNNNRRPNVENQGDDFLKQVISILQSQNGKCSIVKFRKMFASSFGARSDLDVQLQRHSEYVSLFNDFLLLQPKAYTYVLENLQTGSSSQEVRPGPLSWGSGIAQKGFNTPPVTASTSSMDRRGSMPSTSGFISFSDPPPTQKKQTAQAPHERYGMNVPRPAGPPVYPVMPLQHQMGQMIQQQPFNQMMPQLLQPFMRMPFNQPQQMSAFASPALVIPQIAPEPLAATEFPSASPRTGPPPGTKMTDVKEITVKPIPLPRGTSLTTDQVNKQVLECIEMLCEAKEFVSKERLEKFLLEKYMVRHFQDLRLQELYFDNLPAVIDFSKKLGRINSYIQSFVWSRSMCTLYELEECCKSLQPEIKNFEQLKLGPLQKFPLVQDYFKFPTDEYIPEITSVDLIQHLQDFLDRTNSWKTKVNLQEYINYLVEIYHVSNHFSLGVRVRSIPLAIQNLKKSKSQASTARKVCIEELKQYLNRDIQDAFNKFRAHILQKAHDGSQELRRHYMNLSPEDAVREIMCKFELLASIMMEGSSKSQKVDRMLKHFDHFSKNVLDVPIPRMLYHLSVCLSDLHVQESAQEFLELEAKKQEQQTVVHNADNTQKKKIPPTKVALVEKIILYLNKCLEHGTLQLSYLGKIESRVVEDFGFSSFSEMSKTQFLDFVLSEPKIKMVLEECGGTNLGSTSGGHESESIYKPSQLELLQFICQSKYSGATQAEQVENALCEQFHVTDLRYLGHGNIARLSGAAERPGKHVAKEYAVNYEAALCGRQCPTSRSSAKVGIQGNQTKEMAMACLTNCPLLEDMMEWSHWVLVFQPQFGSLRSFIEKYGGLQNVAVEGGHKTAVSDFMALEVEPGKFLKICSQTTQEQFCAALDSGDPVASAGYLVSHIVANKGLESTPLALLSGHVKSCLLSLHARSYGFTNPRGPNAYENHHPTDLAVQFVMEMMVALPVRICGAIANQVLLEPLSSVVGSAKSKKGILEACRLPSQKHRLELLGCLLGLPEWTSSMQFKSQFQASSLINDDDDDGEVPTVQIDDESDANDDSDSDDSDIDAILSDVEEGLQPVPADKIGEEVTTEDDGCLIVKETGSGDDENIEEKIDNEKEKVDEEGENVEKKFEKTLEEGVSEIIIEDSTACESQEEDITNSEGEVVAVEVVKELTREEICQQVVETIQREEFGLGIQLDETGEKLMRKQQERQGRSLQRLSADLYSKETHFVLELIQNADDNSYDDDILPAVKFVIDYAGVTVLNNEMGFEEKNIRALCDVGKSTKDKHKYGYIGQKGIGFKSVFRVTGRPEVHSNGFHVCFDVASGPIGYILPHWINENTEKEEEQEDRWQTRIALPWTEEIKKQIHTHAARFNDIQPSLLLFLHRLKEITIENKVENSVMCMQRKDLPNEEIEISHGCGTERWLVLKKILNASEISFQPKSGVDVESTEIALAFPLQDKISAVHSKARPAKLSVFAFLPLRSYGFRFIVQGDFDVPSSREDVDRDSSWNQWLRNEIHVLFVEALDAFKARPGLSPIQALIMYLQFIPLEGEVLDFFKPVATKILNLLRAKECMPILTDDTNCLQWKMPSKTVIAKDSLVLEIISPALLQRHLGLHYLHPEVAAVLDDALIDALGVESVTTEHLLHIGQSIGRNWDDNGSSEQVTDLAKWLACVYRSLDDFQDNTLSIDKLCSYKIIPLSDGSLVSLADMTVFMLSDERVEDNTKGKKKTKTQDPLLELKKDLKIVHSGLINTSDDEINSQVVKLLVKMGIKQMTAHDIIHSHIVPVLSSDLWKEKKRDVLISYMVYIKTELDRNPSIIDWSDLRKVALLATNNGIKSPQVDEVHFSTVFGNKCDLRKTFPGIEWTLVDSAYMPHSHTQLDVQSWHHFLSELGVVDFLCIKKTELHFSKDTIHETAWSVYKDLWPDSPDGYTIVDFQCEEFHKLVTANQKSDNKYTQMISLFEMLDMEWDGMYKRYKHTQLKSGSGHVLKDVIQSSFSIYLETLAWIPSRWTTMTVHEDNKSVSPSGSKGLHPPAELYYTENIHGNLLAHTVKYMSVAPQKNSSFVQFLKIKTSVDAQTLKNALVSWCIRSETSLDTPRTFSTTIDHIIAIYSSLSDHLSNKDFQDLFHNHPAIFVPVLDPSQVRSGDILVGRMLKRDEVWWSDPTTLFTKHRESLELYKSPLAKRKFLQNWYTGLEEMFLRTARVDAEPNTYELSLLLKQIATVNGLADEDVLRDTLFLFSKIGSDLSKISQTEAGVKTQEAIKAEVYLPKVVNLLTNSAVFPTQQGQWVSLTDNPMVVDSQELEQIFCQKPGIYFVKLEAHESKKPKDRGHRNAIDQTSLKFFISLFESIKPLSQCVRTEEITSHFQQCIKGQKFMHEVVGLIQKFLYFIYPDVHEQVKEKKASSFKELIFSQVGRLEVRYELIDRPDVFEIKEEKCVVKDKNFFFHEKYIDNQTDINREVAKYFSEGNEECVRELRSFLAQVVPILDGSSSESIDELLARQRRPIRSLPSDEEVWEIPPPIIQVEPEPEVIEEEVPTMVYGRALSGSDSDKTTNIDEQGDTNEIKSWPPRSAIRSEPSEQSRKNVDRSSNVWPQSQGPSYATLSKQLPSTIKFEKADPVESSEGTNKEVERSQTPSNQNLSRNSDANKVARQSSEDKGSFKQPSQHGHSHGTARQISDGGANDVSRKLSQSDEARRGAQRPAGELKQDGNRGAGRGEGQRTEGHGSNTADSSQGMDASFKGKRKLTESSGEEETVETKRLNSQEDGEESSKKPTDKDPKEKQKAAVDQSSDVIVVPDENTEEVMDSTSSPKQGDSSRREVVPAPSGSTPDVRRPNKKGIQFFIPVWNESSEDISYTELSRDHDLTIPPILLNDESPPAAIGQWGERLVWDYLQQLKQSNSQILEIVWANFSEETGYPYDFEIIYRIDNCDIEQRTYIEVKSTLSWDKEVFPVSSRQIEFALQHKDHYEIYRVYGAGNRNPKLVRVENVAEKMRLHAVRLFMVL